VWLSMCGVNDLSCSGCSGLAVGVNRCEQSGILKGLNSSAVIAFVKVWLSMCGVLVYEG